MATTYVTQQSVLKEAGLWQRQLAEGPVGSINGTNKVFTVSHKPLADNNYDDTIDASDVTVYVDGVEVQVVDVNEATGSITLVSAPANGTSVTVDYSTSAVSQDDVAGIIEEAQEWIDDDMGQIVDTPYTTVPATVRRIARTYAAGLLMSREYGLQSFGDAGGKEGAAKIKQAEAWLASYRSRIEANGADVGTIVVPRSSTDRRLFQKFDVDAGTFGPLGDENITLNGVE